MANFTRRSFIKLTGGAAALAGMLGVSSSVSAAAGGKKRVVVVGGGVGGATAAKYLRMMDASIEVTLIEPNDHYVTCFMSNEVLSGERTIDSLKVGYSGLKGHGITIVQDYVVGIDAAKNAVMTKGGKTFEYDRCIVSPGVAFNYGAIQGYNEAVAETITHAWKAGPQTVTLRKQLEAMPDGGKVIIVAPPNPYRCPPGPYERASQIAWYLKNHKPKSKIIILDPKDKFAKQGLFTAGWEKHYGYGTDKSIIQWVSGANGGKVEAVDPAKMTVQAAVEEYKGDVINLIPPQKAGMIALEAGLADDKGWCPVNPQTFESTLMKGVHVIGDACAPASVPDQGLPKSAYSANSEAKVVAAAIVALLKGQEVPDPSYVNTCYSLITPEDGISVAGVYKLVDGKIGSVPGAGGLTPGYADSSMEMRKREVLYAHSWFKNIIHDSFG